MCQQQYFIGDFIFTGIVDLVVAFVALIIWYKIHKIFVIVAITINVDVEFTLLPTLKPVLLYLMLL